jgi:hypothetical protein
MRNTALGFECLRTIGDPLELPLQPGASVSLMLSPTAIVWPDGGFGAGDVVGGTGDEVGGTGELVGGTGEVVGGTGEVVVVDDDGENVVDDEVGEKVDEVGDPKEVAGLHLPSGPLVHASATLLWEKAK